MPNFKPMPWILSANPLMPSGKRVVLGAIWPLTRPSFIDQQSSTTIFVIGYLLISRVKSTYCLHNCILRQEDQCSQSARRPKETCFHRYRSDKHSMSSNPSLGLFPVIFLLVQRHSTKVSEDPYSSTMHHNCACA